MAGSKRRINKAIVCRNGDTAVVFNDSVVVYHYRWWFVKVNPKLILPSIRREHRKSIIVNGKVKGKAEMRYGLIPIYRYQMPIRNFRDKVVSFIRKTTGWLCPRTSRGYLRVEIGKWVFIVLHHVTDEGQCVGEVFDLDEQLQIGTFMFNRDFTEVVIKYSQDGIFMTLCTICGYVADNYIYSLAAGSMNHEIKIFS